MAQTTGTDLDVMEHALSIAREGMEHVELPVGAVVALEGKVIASAYTQEVAQRRLLVHVDLLALEVTDRLDPFPGRRRDAVFYVTLEPCLMCMGAAMSFFIGKVVFGLESPSEGAAAWIQTWQRKEDDFPGYRVPVIEGGVLREESAALFSEYVSRNLDGRFTMWAKSLSDLQR